MNRSTAIPLADNKPWSKRCKAVRKKGLASREIHCDLVPHGDYSYHAALLEDREMVVLWNGTRIRFQRPDYIEY